MLPTKTKLGYLLLRLYWESCLLLATLEADVALYRDQLSEGKNRDNKGPCLILPWWYPVPGSKMVAPCYLQLPKMVVQKGIPTPTLRASPLRVICFTCCRIVCNCMRCIFVNMTCQIKQIPWYNNTQLEICSGISFTPCAFAKAELLLHGNHLYRRKFRMWMSSHTFKLLIREE